VPRLSKCAFVFLIAVCSAFPLLACFCVPSPTMQPCERTGIVFVGMVASVEPRSFDELRRKLLSRLPKDVASRLNQHWSPTYMREALRYLLPEAEWTATSGASDGDIEKLFETKFLTRIALVRVVEPFLGIEERQVTFAIGPTNCDVGFKEGHSYLIYAWLNAKTNQIETGVCAGTRPVESATEDLLYFRGLQAGTIRGRVFGFITSDPSDIEAGFRATKPVVGATVTVRSGDRSRKAVTDSEGRYELSGLPPGLYELSERLPGTATGQHSQSFNLSAGACLHQNFLSVEIGQIGGRLLDFNGRPVPNMLVEVEAIAPTEQPHPISQNFTDLEGRFEKTRLVAGEYLLVLNPKTPPNARDWYGKRVPYPRTYYPGVTDRAAAQVFRLDGGQKIDDIDFRLPQPVQPTTLNGAVTNADGRAASAEVWLFDLDYPPEHGQVDSVQANADGSFTLMGAEGRRCLLFAHRNRGNEHLYSRPIEVHLPVDGPIHLVLTEVRSEEECDICTKFPRRW
jgi:hypothetical protein